MKKGLYIGVIALLVAAFLASTGYLLNYFAQSKKQADRYNELSQMVQTATEPSTVATVPTETTAPADTTAPSETAAPTETADPAATEATYPPDDGSGILLPYQQLHKLNSDMVGWIRLDGTVLNYPVMQTSVDNKNFYLYRNFDKNNSTGGSVYVREECDVNKPSDNVTIFGHNMKDGSMFNCLLNYEDKSVWEENSLITFDTLNEYHVYKIFAVFKTSAVLGQGFSYHKFVSAANEREFNDFVATCKKLSFYDTGITPGYGDKLICLSTCEYTLEDGRFVVAAVRIA